MNEITFNQTGDFKAVNAAQKWLHENGYSYGSMCMDMPIGILKGDWCIAKWRNLNAKERKQLDGQLISKDFREGPVVIQLKEPATDEEIQSGARIKQPEGIIDRFINDGGFEKAFNDVFGLPVEVAESLKEVT
jgi:hypothetical protein